MDRWDNRVAVVTGASAGIGAACVRYLLKNGMIVVGLARRTQLMELMRSEMSTEEQKRFHTLRCDVSREEDIQQAFAWIESKLGGVDVLINNAGIARKQAMLTSPDNAADIKAVIETNVMGVAYCTREAFQSMKKRGVDGHVIMINSVLGHRLPVITPGMEHVYRMNIYPASKHALTAMTEELRQEFWLQQTKIKMTSISPGAVDTDILADIKGVEFPKLGPEAIADAVIYCLQTPPSVQIHEMMIKPLGEFP